MNLLLDAALDYAARGWSVLPLHSVNDGECSCGDIACSHPGKHPWTTHGLKDASTDEQQIRYWWGRWPQANLAIATGAASNLVVIDCDSEEATARFLDSYPEAKDTLQAASGKGSHFYFLWEHPIRNDVGKLLGSQIDVRAEGGYVVAPPSVHVTGKHYQWDNDNEVLRLGPSLREVLVRDLRKLDRGAGQTSNDIQKKIPQGQRNNWLTSLAGKMRQQGLGEQAILTALHKENETNCQSPLDDGEVMRIVESIMRYPADETEKLTDAGNARRFATQHGREVRYCHTENKWLIWDGIRWRKDETSQVFSRAKQTAIGIYGAAATATDSEVRKELSKHANRSESARSIREMVTLAKDEPGIAITTDELDANEWLLNVQNGTIDLHTGEIYPHREEDLITKLAPVDYNIEASCPMWDEFLDRIMAGNCALIEFLQRAVGYSLAGDVSEQALFFLYGTGANGKSTFLQAIQDMLGDYAKQAAPNLLVTKRGDSHPTELADLCGSRFVVVVEVEEGRRMAEALVKQMTGGDKIKARFMRQDFFEFSPTHKLFLAANHKPVIRGTDLGIWRRIHLIPFNVTIKPSEQDKHLLQKLRSEMPGILSWAVRGCLAWQHDGLGIPPEVTEATNTYRSEMDVLASFIKECCEEENGQKTQAQDLYDAYKAWCDQNGEKYPLSQRAFSLKLKDKGYVSKRGKGGCFYWQDIGLKDTNNEESARLGQWGEQVNL